MNKALGLAPLAWHLLPSFLFHSILNPSSTSPGSPSHHHLSCISWIWNLILTAPLSENDAERSVSMAQKRVIDQLLNKTNRTCHYDLGLFKQILPPFLFI
jgi:hypothetical protein